MPLDHFSLVHKQALEKNYSRNYFVPKVYKLSFWQVILGNHYFQDARYLKL